MEYYSVIKKNEFELIIVRWMILEPVIQSAVNQKKKNKYHILTYIYEIQKNSTDEPICRAGIETQTENRLWTQWGKERVGRIERAVLTFMSHIHIYVTDTYTLPCVKLDS